MPEPILIIFGITGDLSKRKLLPALYHLLSEGILSENMTIIGVSRHEINVDELLKNVELCVLEKDNICNPDGIAKLKSSLQALKLDPAVDEDFVQLGKLLQELDSGQAKDHLFYMSIPPTAYAPIVKQLGEHGLNGPKSRILLEKPFGYDLESAESLIKLVGEHFSENQIYRTDHYLAKETAQNLLTFRLHNPMFSALWNNTHIQSVHIRATEQIDIESRVDFYEKTGALRDLIQSHLMQLLALTLMDVPADMTSQLIHLSKQYFLEQLLPAEPADSIRGQYEGYKSEVNNDKSTTETFARVKLQHGAERWQGVEMMLETGKAMAAKETSITVTFKSPDGHLPNKLRFEIQPNEGISLDLNIKNPGINIDISRKSLSFDYEQAFQDAQHIEAYERVLIDAIHAEQGLFASAAEVLATWHTLQPIIDAWRPADVAQSSTSQDLKFYTKGTKPEDIA